MFQHPRSVPGPVLHQGECDRDLPQLCPLHPRVPEEIQVRGNVLLKMWMKKERFEQIIAHFPPQFLQNIHPVTRQQLNRLTAFVDGSTVYGSSEEHGAQLRTFDGGQLVINIITHQPPTMEQLRLAPNLRLIRPETQDHFVAGDERVNEHPFLTAMHTIFLKG